MRLIELRTLDGHESPFSLRQPLSRFHKLGARVEAEPWAAQLEQAKSRRHAATRCDSRLTAAQWRRACDGRCRLGPRSLCSGWPLFRTRFYLLFILHLRSRILQDWRIGGSDEQRRQQRRATYYITNKQTERSTRTELNSTVHFIPSHYSNVDANF